MKKIIFSALFILFAMHLFAQTDGISYQAVIIGPDMQELPGVDAEGNILPNATIAIRFSILDASNSIAYREVQTTNTDLYGRVNLIIGKADPVAFATIKWDGTAKDLKVEIDFDAAGNNFINMSREVLTFLPYSYHRDILARGDLVVDGTTDLNGRLIVQGPADLNGSLKVLGPTNLENTLNVNNNSASNLSGELIVDSAATLKSSLTVDGITNLNNTLNVNIGNPVNFYGTLLVKDSATFDGYVTFNKPTQFVELNVNGPSSLKGQVTINANMDTMGGDADYDAYPLLVQGSKQGIAIKVNGNRSTENNFISFWDNNQMWGRIEGVSSAELEASSEFFWGKAARVWDIVVAGYNSFKAGWEIGVAYGELAARSTATTACLGLGGCVTAPPPTPIAMQIVTLVFKIADGALTVFNGGKAAGELAGFILSSENNVGVTYSSGSGDYAEWLPKLNVKEEFAPGELVGIKNGKVTKDLWGVDKIMIVSTKPIVLGNMPQPNEENNNVKIAFMGQVPAKILGKVEPGDYILPNEFGGGLGKAVSPKNMKTSDYKKVAGVVWNIIKEITEGVNIVNVAVGINTNDLSEVIVKQEAELIEIKKVFEQLNARVSESNLALTKLVPGYAEEMKLTFSSTQKSHVDSSNQNSNVEDNVNKNQNSPKNNIITTNEDDIIYFEISREQIETGISMAREQYLQMLDDKDKIVSLLLGNNQNSIKDLGDMSLIPIEDHPFWQKIDNDPAYKEEIIQYIQSGFVKAFHTHKKYAHLFTDLKIKE